MKNVLQVAAVLISAGLLFGAGCAPESTPTLVPTPTSVAGATVVPAPTMTLTALTPTPTVIRVLDPLARQTRVYDLYAPPSTLTDLVAKSDLIFVGTPSRLLDGLLNSARSGNGPSQTIFNLHRVYEVRVERYLKGEGSASVRIGLETEFYYEWIVRGNGPEVLFQIPIDSIRVPTSLGQRYVFFANIYAELPDGILFGRGDAGRFILKDGRATVVADADSKLVDYYRYYPSLPEKDFLADVVSAVAAAPTRTPSRGGWGGSVTLQGLPEVPYKGVIW